MTHSLPLQVFESPTALIIALAGLVEALRRLVKAIRALHRDLPESLWPSMVGVLSRARACVIEELTPPKPSPTIDKASRVLYAAVFYVLTLQCTCLLLVDGLLVATSDVSIWRKLLGAGVLFLIVLAGRFSFAQAEKLRFKLKTDSRRLW